MLHITRMYSPDNSVSVWLPAVCMLFRTQTAEEHSCLTRQLDPRAEVLLFIALVLWWDLVLVVVESGAVESFSLPYLALKGSCYPSKICD